MQVKLFYGCVSEVGHGRMSMCVCVCVCVCLCVWSLDRTTVRLMGERCAGVSTGVRGRHL